MEDMGIGAGLGAIGLWSFIAVVIVAGIWDGIRKREAQHETLRRMIESGQPIDQALMDKLLGGSKRLDLDLKVSGLIVLFVAPGLALLGWFISRQSAEWLLPMLGVSALVGCVSIGLLVASKVIGRSYREDDASAPNHPMA
jgi:hypothetical protein